MTFKQIGVSSITSLFENQYSLYKNAAMTILFFFLFFLTVFPLIDFWILVYIFLRFSHISFFVFIPNVESSQSKGTYHPSHISEAERHFVKAFNLASILGLVPVILSLVTPHH